MERKQELTKLSESIKQQRDEINQQLSLAGTEAKEEWQKAETQWRLFVDKLAEVVDGSKETTGETIDKTKIIGEELMTAYKNISQRLSR